MGSEMDLPGQLYVLQSRVKPRFSAPAHNAICLIGTEMDLPGQLYVLQSTVKPRYSALAHNAIWSMGSEMNLPSQLCGFTRLTVRASENSATPLYRTRS